MAIICSNIGIFWDQILGSNIGNFSDYRYMKAYGILYPIRIKLSNCFCTVFTASLALNMGPRPPPDLANADNHCFSQGSKIGAPRRQVNTSNLA